MVCVCVCVVACNIYFSLHYVIDLNLLEYMRIQYMMHRLRGIAKALSYYLSYAIRPRNYFKST